VKRAARPTIDDAASRGALAGFLYGCHMPTLADITVDELLRRYRVSVKVAEYELTIARQKRAGEVGK
jgi:hypothetical protein